MTDDPRKRLDTYAEGYGITEESPTVAVPAAPLTFHNERIGTTPDGKPVVRPVADQAVTIDPATGAITSIEEVTEP